MDPILNLFEGFEVCHLDEWREWHRRCWFFWLFIFLFSLILLGAFGALLYMMLYPAWDRLTGRESTGSSTDGSGATSGSGSTGSSNAAGISAGATSSATAAGASAATGDDLTLRDSIDADIAAKLKADGIDSYTKLDGLDDARRLELAAKYGIPATALGLAADDLAQRDGIDADTAAKLNAAGIYNFDQLDGLDDAARAELAAKYGLPGAALGLHSDKVDDLTERDGIDVHTAAKLNQAGIYNFDQLDSLDQAKAAGISVKYGIPAAALGLATAGNYDSADETWEYQKDSSSDGDGDRDYGFAADGGAAGAGADVDEWPRIPTEAEIGARATELSQWRAGKGIDATQEDDWHLGERELYMNACELDGSPDRLAFYDGGRSRSAIDGVSDDHAAELSRLGYPSAAALAAMTAADKAQVQRWFDARGKDFDLDAAIASAQSQVDAEASAATAGFAGESVHADDDFGVLYSSRPDQVDDLTEISGVGEVIEGRLNDDGVYRFKQIAGWSDANALAFGKKLDFPGRIEREEWIPQAQRLAQMEEERANLEPEPEPENKPTLDDYAGLDAQYAGEDVRTDEDLGVLFQAQAHCEDDLTQIKGIGKVLNKTLNDRGVYRFQQIADWNEYNVWSFNQIIAFPGRIQRDEWIAQAAELAPSSSCLASADDAAGSQDADLGFLYSEKPEQIDDLTEISGIGQVIEGRLNDDGVYRFQQIADWSDANANAFGDRFEFPGRVQREEWIPQAQRLAQMEEERANLEPEPEPENKPTLDDYAGLDAQYAGEDVRTDEDLGVLFQAQAHCEDDLTQIKGIGKVLNKTLNDRGVYRFQQIADWNEYNVWSFNQIIAFPGRIQRDEWIAQAAELAPSSSCLASADDAAGSQDADLGFLYSEKPEQIDDLTEISGIGQVIEGRLNDDGVYRFQQIADWSDANANAFGDRFEFPGRVQREEWIPQAQRLVQLESERANLEPEPEPENKPTMDDYEGFDVKYPGEDIRTDQDLGILFQSEANCADDLTKIKGVGKVLNKTLNDRGVFRFQQIADWNEYNVWSFNQIIAFPGRIQRDEWIKQCEELALTSRCTNVGAARVTSEDLDEVIYSEFEGEDVEIRPPFGIVYKSAPANPDNLQDIWGVGPVLEKKLHDFGVYRFKQIANWPDDAIDEFQEQLSFPDRIRRDDWVSQSEQLARGEKPNRKK